METFANITVGKLAEQVRSILSGGNVKPETIPSRRMCVVYVQQAYDEAISEMLTALSVAGRHGIPPDLLSHEKVETTRVNNELRTAKLKNRVLGSVPGGGIRLITDEDGCELIEVAHTFRTMFRGKELSNMEGHPIYWRVGNDIYAQGNKCGTLDITAIFAGEKYGEHDEMALTPELQRIIVTKAAQSGGLQKEGEDLITDNTKT